MYGRLSSLEGLSLNAQFFETSPIPGVYGNFVKFANSQGINLLQRERFLQSRIKESAWNKNMSLTFKQKYDSLNFTLNMTDQFPPLNECSEGYFIIRSNISENGYIC
jgi:hypothetical protein